MTLGRYVGAGALVIGVTAFSLTDRAGPSVPVATAPVSAASDLLPVREADQPTVPEREAPAVAPRATASPANARRGNSGRFRGFNSRNRYPGPIPTPAEWVAPAGPVRIALQAGHWKANEAPAELSGLKDNGTSAAGKAEWEVNLAVARKTAALLEAKGYLVDILPAVVPPDYRAHLFIAIHADGSADTQASGFRVAAPGRDATGRASQVVALLEESYGNATGLRLLPDVTRRMENYYAFNFRRYEHALHPMTIGVIIETGFLTSPSDRHMLVDETERVARGIVNAVVAFPITPPPAPAAAIAVD